METNTSGQVRLEDDQLKSVALQCNDCTEKAYHFVRP